MKKNFLSAMFWSNVILFAVALSTVSADLNKESGNSLFGRDFLEPEETAGRAASIVSPSQDDILGVSGGAGSASAAPMDYTDHRVLRVYLDSPEEIAELNEFLKQIPDSLVEVWKEGKPTDIFVHPGMLNRVEEYLARKQWQHEVIVDNFAEAMAEQRAMRAHPGRRPLLDRHFKNLHRGQKFDLGVYHPHAEINEYLRDLAQRFPALVQLGTIGKSFEGRDMLYVKIGRRQRDNSEETGEVVGLPPKKTQKRYGYWIDAGIHAREWIAPAVALFTIDQLLNNPRYSPVLEAIDVYVLPSLNPDGYEYSQHFDRMWRRTRTVRANDRCIGVDGNRNFGYHWNETGTTGYCSQIYSGPGPLSEPETRQLAAFLDANKNSLRAYLTLHSYGNLLMHPYAHKENTYPPDVKDLIAVGNEMAKTIMEANGPKFTVGSGADILYEAAGTSDSYAKSIGIKYAYTMELTSGRPGGFVFPQKMVTEFAKSVCPGILRLAEKLTEESMSLVP